MLDQKGCCGISRRSAWPTCYLSFSRQLMPHQAQDSEGVSWCRMEQQSWPNSGWWLTLLIRSLSVFQSYWCESAETWLVPLFSELCCSSLLSRANLKSKLFCRFHNHHYCGNWSLSGTFHTVSKVKILTTVYIVSVQVIITKILPHTLLDHT